MKPLTFYLFLFVAVIAIALPTINNIKKSPLGTQLELNRMEKAATLKELSP